MSAGTTSRTTPPAPVSGRASTGNSRAGKTGSAKGIVGLRDARSGSGRQTNREALRGFLDRPMASFYLVLIFTAALLSIGVVMMLSASSVDSIVKYGGNAYALFERQIIWVGIGFVALWFGTCLRPSFYRKIAPLAMLLSLLLLAAVLIPGIGTELNGGRRWLDLGPMLLQPSELAKLAFVLWGADLLVRKDKLLGQWRHLLIPLLPGLGLVGGLVVLEPDLGTTVCFFLIFLALLWTVGAPVRLFVLMLVAICGAGVLAITSVAFRQDRIGDFLNPWADAQDGGLQAVQGLVALGSGGWFGLGLGNSRQKWGLLPNGHSDYIFAIIGEELGLVGCVVLLLLYAGVAYTGFRIAHRTADPFIRLASSAIVVWLIGQAVINIGYVVGLLPVTGIPLPFISSGGTSLVLTMFVMGILASFARHEPQAVKTLQRSQTRLGRLLRLPVPRSAVDGTPQARRRRPPPATRRPVSAGRTAGASAGTTGRPAGPARAESAPGSRRRQPAGAQPGATRSRTRRSTTAQPRTTESRAAQVRAARDGWRTG